MHSLKKIIKVALRSKSFGFARDFGGPALKKSKVIKTPFGPIIYRPGTSDQGVIYDVLLRGSGEYHIETKSDVDGLILDVGANIGATSLFYAKRFPKAQILAFEPHPDNYSLLLRNTANHPNIKTFPFGLGGESGVFNIYEGGDALNKGGFSLLRRSESKVTAPVAAVEIKAVQEIAHLLTNKKLSILKVDTEGSEYEIIEGLSTLGVLNAFEWIIGELHGEKDFSTLAVIEKDFQISVSKPLRKKCFSFLAHRSV